jgi:hypothetical protein
MKVRELVIISQSHPNQDAKVVIGEGSTPEVWIAVTGIVERRIKPLDPDVAVPGDEPAIEIV